MQISFRVHQQFHAAVSQNARTEGRIVVTATSSNIILRCDKKFCHGFRAEIRRHNNVPHFVASYVRNLSWPVTLMPVSGDQNPSTTANFRKKGLVRCPGVRRNILFVNAISDACSVELVGDFGTIPILVKVEG